MNFRRTVSINVPLLVAVFAIWVVDPPTVWGLPLAWGIVVASGVVTFLYFKDQMARRNRAKP